MRQRDIDDLRPRRFQPFRTLGPQLVDGAIHAVGAVFLRDTNPKALDTAFQRGPVIGHRQIDGCRILHIVSGHRLKHQGGILHRAGQWPRLVKR